MNDSKKIDDGGAAFPPSYEPDPSDPMKAIYRGITKRDWFAGQALNAIAATSSASSEEAIPDLIKKIAEVSYKIADAMIAARKGGAA